MIVIVVCLAGAYTCFRFNKRNENDISIYDENDEHAPKRKSFLGKKDTNEKSPFGPGEGEHITVGINNDDSTSLQDSSYDEHDNSMKESRMWDPDPQYLR